jgi:hypothetical protein
MNALSKFSCGSSLLKTPTAVLGLILFLAITSTQLEARHWWWFPKRSVCEKIAYKTFTSDLIEASADYTLATAKAYNIPDREERGEAFRDAYDEYKEAREEARDQLVARIELCDQLDEERYYPEIDPEDFCTPEEISANPNPYFMLVTDRVMIYGGETEEGDEEIIEVTVTDNTIEIMGVTCVEVRDIVTIDGEIVEDTRDWYSQDKDGNVWYFGEIALNYEDGQVSDLDGSWKGGEDGAIPGILMWANPQIGQIYRQEFLLGEAEDVAEVGSLTETVISNEIEYTDCLQTFEFTPLEPDSFEYKYYKSGVGLVLEENPDTGEVLELLAINP